MRKKLADGTEVVSTICDGCHSACGALAYVKDGRVVRVEGAPEFPESEGYLCPMGLSSTQVLYHPKRNKYPMKRVGGRGEGKWQRISWDEALDTVAARFKEIAAKWGPESVTWSWGDHAFHDQRCNFKMALLHAIGSPTHWHTDAHYCYSPLLIANICTFGEGLLSERGPDYRNSRCIMLWGGNQVACHGGRGRDIMIGKSRGAKLIVIDPRMSNIASKADMFLQVRPATDDALALGMLNVIINEELYDKEFVENWCVGFPELKERVQQYPTSRVAEITWVPEEDIIAAARMYAENSPGASMHGRMGIQQHRNTHQTCRAISIMTAICNNLDVKGGNVFGRNYKGFKAKGMVEKKDLPFPPEVANKRIGAKEYPLFSSANNLVGGLCHPPSVLHTILTGEPYPVKANWALNDLMVCFEDSKEMHEALMKLEFLVGSDFFMTPTMEMCDIVLPPSFFLEKEGIEDQMYQDTVAAKEQVVPPVYDTMDDRQMDLEVARRMGLELPWKSIHEFHDYLLSDCGITFDELKERHFVTQPIKYMKYGETGFKTPSGKVELWASLTEGAGDDPLPYYVENAETPVATPEIAKDYPLILITGHRINCYFHSNGRQIPWCREIEPYPRLTIYPDTAAKLNIEDGDWAWVEAPENRGRVQFKAQVTEKVDPRVVAVPSHWWYPEKKDDPLHGWLDSNINSIISNDGPYDKITGSTTLRGLLCKVYKVAEGEETPEGDWVHNIT